MLLTEDFRWDAGAEEGMDKRCQKELLSTQAAVSDQLKKD